jgi:hypothetical protein
MTRMPLTRARRLALWRNGIGRGGGAGGVIPLATRRENLRTRVEPNGRDSTATMLVPGVDTLPAGLSYNAGTRTVTVSGFHAVVPDIDLRDCRLVLASGATILHLTQCYIGETVARSFNDLINGAANARIWLIDYCTFENLAAGLGAGQIIGTTLSGTGVSFTAFEVNIVTRCRFIKPHSDCIQGMGSGGVNGQLIEWNYFGPPSQTGSADPHADAITCSAVRNRVTIRNNLFDWTRLAPAPGAPVSDYIQVTNGVRMVRPTGTDRLFEKVEFYDNTIYHGDSLSYSFQATSGGQANYNGPINFLNNIIQNGGPGAFHPTTETEFDLWVNNVNESGAPWAAPSAASTTDISADPVNTVAPGLTGTPASGATLTATVGTWTGFPEPIYTVTLEVSDDGVSGWTTHSAGNITGLMTYTAVAGDIGKHLRVKVGADNNRDVVTAYSAAVGPVAAGYAPKFVNTNGTAHMQGTPSGASGTKVEFCVRIKPNDLSTPNPIRLLRASNGIDIRFETNGAITVVVNDSAGTVIWNAASASGQFVAGTERLLYVSYDATAAVGVVRRDNAAVTMTPTVGPISGTGSVRPNLSHAILGFSAALVARMTVSDFYVRYANTLLGGDAFWNGGVPLDFTTLAGSPQFHFGKDMTADERAGNAAQGWNDGYNLGSVTMTVNSATYTDVP